MSNGNKSAQLAGIVKRVVGENDLPMFEEYWELYEHAADISNVQAFYIRIESFNDFGHESVKYCNVAILGEGLVVDVEGDDSKSTGSLTLSSLDSFSHVSFHAGSLPGLPSSQGASLVVLAHSAGESDAGPYWVAKTEEEEDYLLSFAQSLVRAISKQ